MLPGQLLKQTVQGSLRGQPVDSALLALHVLLHVSSEGTVTDGAVAFEGGGVPWFWSIGSQSSSGAIRPDTCRSWLGDPGPKGAEIAACSILRLASSVLIRPNMLGRIGGALVPHARA